MLCVAIAQPKHYNSLFTEQMLVKLHIFTKKIGTVASCGKSFQLLWEDLGLSALLKGRMLQLANMIKTGSQGCAKFRIEKLAPFQFVWVWKYPEEIVCLSCLSFSLLVALSFILSVAVCLLYLSVISVTLSLYLSLSVCLHDALPISHSICLHMSFYQSFCLSVCMSFCLCIGWKLFMNPIHLKCIEFKFNL